MKTIKKYTIIIAFLMILPVALFANNLQLNNVVLTGKNIDEDFIYIRFDLSWENSWRFEDGAANWDAAWLFAKYRVDNGDWHHCTLSVEDDQHFPANGAQIDASFEHDNNGAGAFIYRNVAGNGDIDWQNNQLRWNYGMNGVSDDDEVEIELFGIEMVYVPAGHHNLNAANLATLDCAIYNDPMHENSMIEITGEDAIPAGSIRWKNEFVWGGVGFSNGFSYGCDSLRVEYPKGFQAFYCMKYELSQEQYAEFLNSLTLAQATERNPIESGNYTTFRGTISGQWPEFSASRPDRAANFICFMDHLAFLDWAGLRPMTELEFNKACRGDRDVVPNEYAYGTNNFVAYALNLSGEENGTETITDAGANAAYSLPEGYIGGDGGRGPLRCGIFATPNATTREQTGASYYGIMDLSGNVTEQCITIAGFRGFESIPTNAGQYDGSHGDGELSND
nr:SUMF1/EgtB/PvdO family nonheme iron enzyme [Candidatus Cloacimonadota bacterium]